MNSMSKDSLRASGRSPSRNPLRVLILLGFTVPVVYFVWLIGLRPSRAPAARPVTSPARGPATSYPKGAAANGGHGLNGQTDPDSADDRLRFLGQEDRDDAIEQRARQIRDSGIGGFYLTPWEQQPPWPWQKIKDHHFQELGIIGICAPFEDAFYIRSTMKGLFWEFKNAGLIMFGIASYEDFPGEIINPADSRHVSKDMPEIIDGMDFWLHCFRDPSAFGLPPGVPRILLSESDFVNFYRDDGGGRLMPKEGVEAPSKQYDAIYVNRGGAWNDYNRNWTVAEPSMIRLAGDLGFKIAAIDRMPSDASLSSLPEEKRGLIEKIQSQPWNKYLEMVERTRMILLPNVHDASPRVITEAMSLNVPILMNRNILGGWKYLEWTDGRGGAFFENQDDVVDAARKILQGVEDGSIQPREAIMSRWGHEISSARLRALLEEVVGLERLAEVRDLAIRYQIRPPRRVLAGVQSSLGHHMEDPGDPHAWHHTPADRSLLDVSDIGPIVVKHVRGLAAHWPEGEAPEVITPLGRHLRFDGVRRWLREEGANAPEEVRRMATDVMASFGVLE